MFYFEKFQAEPTSRVRRWSRTEKKEVEIQMPGMISEYNTNMGGVDLLDQMTAAYRIRIRKRKWWWCIYNWSLSVSAINSWRLMMHVKKEKIPYLFFLRQLVMEMMKVHGVDRVRPGPSLVLRGTAAESMRRDGKDHWIVSSETQQLVCRFCKGRSSWKCDKCNVGLHAKCFKVYHVAS